VQGTPYTLHDLEDVDGRYARMYRDHEAVHRGAIQELAGRGYRSVLEVACGTGWNVPNFRAAGLAYTGLDISETAVALAAMKHPEGHYLNLGIRDARVLRGDSFDAVYSSSMLEHIGYPEEALAEMVRLARHEVRVLFFEGLSDLPDHQVEFHPHDENETGTWRPSRTDRARVEKSVFGVKLLLQDHGPERRRGWYWNRYSRSRLLASIAGLPVRPTVLGSTDRPWIRSESVLVLAKSSTDPGLRGSAVD
jgi:SAM-dependent methyltransferase